MHRARDVRGRVGIFFVHKKNNKVRFIIDARVVNMRFVAPPSVSLMTSEGFAMIEVELDSNIDSHSAEGKEALDALGLLLGDWETSQTPSTASRSAESFPATLV